MNHFENTIKDVADRPQQERGDALIDGIAQVFRQQSTDNQTKELAQQLTAAKSQLVRSLNQREGQQGR